MDLKKIKDQLNDNIEKVLDKLNIEYEKFGDNIYSKCPIHDSSDNPRACSYSTDKKIWKCWTRECQNEFNNDIFGLIRGTLSNQTGKEVDFKQTLKWSCKLLDIKSEYKQTKPVGIQEDDIDRIIKIFNKTECIHTQKSIDLQCSLVEPSEYFIQRGFNPSTLKHFGVGDCHEKGFLKDRAIIPIHNETGEYIVGAIGRTIKEYRSPKFLIYPKGFDKRYYFYNYHRAINKAQETSCLFVMEGQGDVWKMYEAGVTNAVSLFGKTISEQHEAKLAKMAITHLVILMDNDQAGKESKMQIQRKFGRMYKLIFPRISNKDVGDMSVEKIKSEILSNLKGYY